MKKLSFLFLLIVVFLSVCSSVMAAPDQVKNPVISAYDHNQFSYGFFKKCGSTATIGIAFTNLNPEDYTVTFPKTGKITTNGTIHNIYNLRTKDSIDPGKTNPLSNVDLENGTEKSKNPFTIKAGTTKPFMVLFDIDNMTVYNLWNDTQFQYTIEIEGEGKTEKRDIRANLFQRGNSCASDQVCTASVISGNYSASGSGSINIMISNNMPDSTYVVGKPDVEIIPASGNPVKVPNGVTWNTQPGGVSSGSSVNISGKLSLPPNEVKNKQELNLKFHFYHPSSLNFGDFYATGKLKSSDGVMGELTGSFDVSGKGTFSAVLNNYSEGEVNIALPETGKVTDSEGKSYNVNVKWNTSKSAGKTVTVTIPPSGKKELSGTFTFTDKTPIASNNTLILSADFSSGSVKGSAAGTVIRNADPNPVIRVLSLCRQYTAGSKKVTFTYELKNEASTDIRVELASSLSVPGNVWNPKTKYTHCVSSGQSCMNRMLNGASIIIKTGETIKFSGEAELEKAGGNDLTIQTSLRYFADGKTYAIPVGKAGNSCSGPVDPVPTSQPTVTPYPEPDSELKAVSFCRMLSSSNVVELQYTLQNLTKSPIRTQLAQTLAVQGFDNLVGIKYSACENLDSTACSLSSDGYHIIGAGKSVRFKGTAQLPKAPSSSDFTVRTSLIYYYGSDDQARALFIGRTSSSSCGDSPVPAAVITSSCFCRSSFNGSTLNIAYALENPNKYSIEVELAKTLLVEGVAKYLPITYEKKDGLNGYMYTLAPGQNVWFYGTVTPGDVKLPNNYFAYTSLVYYPNGIRSVLNLGKTTDFCTNTKDVLELMAKNVERPAANLTAFVGKETYGSCDNKDQMKFTLNISNSGMDNGYVDLSSSSLWLNGQNVPFTIVSCSVNSVSGTDSVTCAEEMKSGIFTVNPNVTLSLDLTAQKQVSGDTVSAAFDIPGIAPELIEFETPVSDFSCESKAAAVPGAEGKAVRTSVSASKDVMNLMIEISNDGDADAVVTPGAVYFDRDVLERYLGSVQFESLGSEITAKDSDFFVSGEKIVIPAQSSAHFTIGVNVNLAEAFDNTADLTWHFDLNGQPVNYPGTVDFAQKSISAAEKSIIWDQGDSGSMLHFYNIGTPVMPERLPATGFPTKGVCAMKEQPADLKYKDLNGLHLEIPVIDAMMDLVQVYPDENNEWAVEWLGDRGGVLSSGSLPGKGTSVIAAHNHLDALKAGPFDLLKEVKEKDRIFVTDAKGKVLTYSVYANELVKPNEAGKLYENSLPGSLVLVTCESEMPEGGYAFRRVVYAEPLQ